VEKSLKNVENLDGAGKKEKLRRPKEKKTLAIMFCSNCSRRAVHKKEGGGAHRNS
jgi:hypothetical protein